jgi:hypothetical protein
MSGANISETHAGIALTKPLRLLFPVRQFERGIQIQITVVSEVATSTLVTRAWCCRGLAACVQHTIFAQRDFLPVLQ